MSNGPTKEQLLAPAFQMGTVVRKQFNQVQDRWEVAIGVRNSEQEVILAFSYTEMEVLIRTVIGILDGFTPEQKRTGFADRKMS